MAQQLSVLVMQVEWPKFNPQIPHKLEGRELTP